MLPEVNKSFPSNKNIRASAVTWIIIDPANVGIL